jgi:hypothetical protein
MRRQHTYCTSKLIDGKWVSCRRISLSPHFLSFRSTKLAGDCSVCHCTSSLLVVFRFGLTWFYLAAVGAQESARGFRFHLPLLTVRRHHRMGLRDDVLRVLDRRAPARHHRPPAGGFAGVGNSSTRYLLQQFRRDETVLLRPEITKLCNDGLHRLCLPCL